MVVLMYHRHKQSVYQIIFHPYTFFSGACSDAVDSNGDIRGDNAKCFTTYSNKCLYLRRGCRQNYKEEKTFILANMRKNILLNILVQIA
jgi:hypothetical protein